MVRFPKPSEVPRPEGREAQGCLDPDRQIFSTSQRDRLLSGAVQAVGEHGYPAATVAQILSGRHISRRTFYEHFADKQDCVLAAHDRVVEWLGKQVAEELIGVESWLRAVPITVRAILAAFDADPDLARLCAIEILSLGRPGVARYDDSIARLVTPLRAGRARCPWGTELPLSLEETVIGGAIWLVGSRARSGDGGSLGELAPELTYFLLSPYLGIPQARRQALGEPFLLSPVKSG